MRKVMFLLALMLLPLSPYSAEAFGFKIVAGIVGVLLPKFKDIDPCHLMQLFNASCPQGIDNGILGSQINAPGDVSSGTLLLNFSIGDAQQKVSLIADTTTDLTFMLCQPCRDCAVETDIAVYNSSRSLTFSKYTCQGSTECLASRYTACSSESCTYYYADYPYITSKGFLAKDTFSVSRDTQVPIVFGCGSENAGNFGDSIGYVGLGLGNLSFVSQLNVSIFSYCFSSYPSGSSFFFGSDVQMHSALVISTKLIPNVIDPTLYYVNMTGITVGEKRVEIPTTAYLPQPNGSGGMIIDSASSVTMLEESAYFALKQEFINQMKLPQADASKYDFDLCFITCKEEHDVHVADLILHFDGGADMHPNNYFMKTADGKALCLAMLPAKGISVLGNLMQSDLHMVFDISNSVLRFESANCSSL